MSHALDRMIQQLTLQPLAPMQFLGQSSDLLGSGRIFGGQILGQALMACVHTVDPARKVHSLHSYFLRPGNVDLPIRYDVENVRDGGSFSSRLVAAYQNDKHIFTMAASFQTPEPGFSHQAPMPADLLPPEQLQNEQQLVAKIADQLPPSVRKRHLDDGMPIEFRPRHPERHIRGGQYEPNTYIWFRANGHIPNNPLVHKAVLAYASDYYFLFASLFPHEQGHFDPHLQMASIDHAVWFHRPINVNEWNVYVVSSPNASGARGLSLGHVYNQQGELLATTAQEGLIRNTQRFPKH